MKRNREGLTLFLRRSCITGKVVWAYYAKTAGAANTAYCRACKKEIERVKHWPETVAKRRAEIMKFMNECLANIPINQELTPRQKEGARRLQAEYKKDIPCYMGFYEHVMEERRRRAEDKEIRRKMREREQQERKDKEKITNKKR